MTVSDRRVPGVYFLPPPVRRGLGLPPLDVAAFVGFAEKGPVDLPVPIGDVNTYRSIFGGDLALAREDGERTVYANLPQSVSAFFANGGRRCYIVRVTGAGATNTRCRLPGLVALGRDGIQLASINASSPGRWSAGFRLGTRLERVPLPLDAFTHATEEPMLLRWNARAAPAAIQPGDLLKLTLVDEGGNRQQALFPVSAVTRGADAAELVTLSASQTYSTVLPSNVRPNWMVADTRRLTADAPADDVFVFDMRVEDDAIVLTADVDDETALGQGDVLLLTVSLDPANVGTFLFPIAGVRQAGGDGSPPDSSPQEGSVELRATAMVRLDADQSVAGALASVERLRFELALRDGDQRRATIGDLAFNSGHPTFWGEVALLESSPLRPRPERPAVAGANLVNGAVETPAAKAARIYNLLQTDQRIDSVRDGVPSAAMLAGLLAPVGGEDTLFLPLDMPGVLTDNRVATPSVSDVGRDGLDRFDGDSFDWFVDKRLTLTSSDPSLRTAELMGNAFDIQYVQNKRLRGLHSLLWIDEVALISVPEAVQRNWSPGTPPPDDVVLAVPDSTAPDQCPPIGPFLNCIRVPEIAEIEPATGPLRGGTRVVVRGEGFDPVGAATVSFGGVPASDVVVLSVGDLHCTTPAAGVSGPVAVEVTTSAGTGTKPNGFRYLPETVEPVLPELAPLGDYGIDAALSPLLPLQREVLRCCVARDDAVAILTLPRHFEKRDCIDWQQALRGYLGLPRRRSVFNDVREIADLSYAAVYHPWLMIRDPGSPDAMRAVVADGAVCGMIAARERERQVWVAPANLPLEGVLGLVPPIPEGDWAELFEAQFNLVRGEPRDFRPMSAHTLSDEAILLQLSVRRLMILLRKAAYLRGLDYVFESNHERFREGVRAVLSEMLRFLFERGAFAGPTPASSYRVVTDERVNPPESVDQGRFIAEIQVAPSQPAEFITVVLSRVGDQLQLTEG